MQMSAGDWDTIKTIVGIIAQAIGIALTVAAVLGKWLRNQLNGVSEKLHNEINGVSTRIDAEIVDIKATQISNEKVHERTDVKLTELDRRALQSEFERHTLQEKTSRLEGMVETLVKELARDREVRVAEDKSTAVQLSRIEQGMQMGNALAEGFKSVVAAMKENQQGRQ